MRKVRRTKSRLSGPRAGSGAVGILAQRQNPERDAMLQTAEKAGIAMVGPLLVDSGSDADYRRFFAATSQEGADALFVDGSPENITKRQLIVELAAKFRLPAIYPFRSFVEAGGLMAYGTELGEVFRQAARSIDKILKGTNPGDIPFYLPTKFELVINLGREVRPEEAVRKPEIG
jgi:putative tryptophan/tyrosine transport system substrate-binding protein